MKSAIVAASSPDVTAREEGTSQVVGVPSLVRRDLAPFIAPPNWNLHDHDRLSTLGASETPKAVGILPATWENATPEHLEAEKLGLVPPFQGNLRTRMGTALETPVLIEYAQGRRFEKLRTIVHPVESWLSATPDAWMVEDDHLCQVKCTRFASKKEWGEPGTDQVPPWVAVQCSVEMFVADRDRCDVAVLIGGGELRTYTLRRDPEVERRVLGLAREFWKRIETKRGA